MNRVFFHTEDGREIPAVSESEMREVDRLAVEVYGLHVLQMMENAGRNLAQVAMQNLNDKTAPITLLAGSGGNGGGGLCAARHLLNHGYQVDIIISRPANSLSGPARAQWAILNESGIDQVPLPTYEQVLNRAELILDALIGYSLRGAPTGESERLIDLANATNTPILSLDLPSGLDATDGSTPGSWVAADTVLTLALPKTGLQEVNADLLLGDIGIPADLFSDLGFTPPPFPPGEYIVTLQAP